MGSIAKAISKPFKSAAKFVTTAVKKVAKGIVKVGKAVMKGVAKISNKLGPIGMIALSIAMPYALTALSSWTTAMQGYQAVGTWGNFVRSVGTIGNSIRTGYQAFNTAMSGAGSWIGDQASSLTKSITQSISDTFTRFAPEGTGNMFSKISEGAKNLYDTAANTIKEYMPKPLTAQGGTVNQIDSGFLTNNAVDPGINVLSSTDAAKYIQSNQQSFLSAGKNVASEFSNQTLSQKGGWFTSINEAGVRADRLVTQTINDAYKIRLEGFGENSLRMFNDIKTQATKLGTYVNDEQIGSYVQNNLGSTSYAYQPGGAIGDTDMLGDGPFRIKTEVPNLEKTGDYLDDGQGGYRFTGNKTFESPPVKNAYDDANKAAKNKVASAARGYLGSLLTPTDKPIPQPAYYAGATSYDGNTSSTYGGTNIQGSQGGNLVAQVFGEASANQIKNYYQNMNILGSV